MIHPDAKVEKVYLSSKPVDFRKSIDGLETLAALDIKVAVFDLVLSRLAKRATHLEVGGVYGALTNCICVV